MCTDAPTESTHLSQHTLPMHSQPPHSSALTVRRPLSPLTRSQQASTSTPLLGSRRWSRQLNSRRVGHRRSANEHVYQRNGARPAASTTPPTAVTKLGTILHFMYHNTSIHAMPEIGPFHPPLGPQRAGMSRHPPQAPQHKPKVPVTCGHRNEHNRVLSGPGLDIRLLLNSLYTAPKNLEKYDHVKTGCESSASTRVRSPMLSERSQHAYMSI